MINIISKPIEFEIELKKKIEFICDFCNTKPKIINGNIRNIEHSNLSYIEPHRVIIKDIMGKIYQAFARKKFFCNRCDNVFDELYVEEIIDNND